MTFRLEEQRTQKLFRICRRSQGKMGAAPDGGGPGGAVSGLFPVDQKKRGVDRHAREVDRNHHKDWMKKTGQRGADLGKVDRKKTLKESFFLFDQGKTSASFPLEICVELKSVVNLEG